MTHDKTGKLVKVYAKDEGCVGDEMIDQYDFMGLGSLTLDETDDITTIFNIRLIDKNHPKYNSDMAKNGKQLGDMISMFEKMMK